MDKTILGAFKAMEEAYGKFLREADELKKELSEHRMSLPPTLGYNGQHSANN